MSEEKMQKLPAGVMLNAYPDSIGRDLSDLVEMLQRPEFRDVFSHFYILPTFFHSDLDRGFSVIDYDINEELVSPEDLAALELMGIKIKLDLVLNHLSVRSPQFMDLLKNGSASPYHDYFVDWNEFWKDHGVMGPDGHVVPHQEHLDQLFMRKPDLPILKLRFPDGSIRAYWNTFYQKVDFDEITASDFAHIEELDPQQIEKLVHRVKVVIERQDGIESLDLSDMAHLEDQIFEAICNKREFLGQMDLNARSELVWAFYDETLRKLSRYGAHIIRLDAFAYLHKEPGKPNFFNRPGTWEYLERLRGIAQRHGLIIFPEIHSEYGAGIHEEIAQEGYPIYDFYFPGLVIDALERGSSEALIRWIRDVREKKLQTINMLGCHDGIPVLDLKGKRVNEEYVPGLLSDEDVDALVDTIIERGGRTKNLYDAAGKKIDYYQINATFFSALGENEQKLRLARAIQVFMPGIPQVWYLDLFAGTNDYAAADRGRTAGHKEINRTTLKLIDIEMGLKRDVVRDQLELLRLRNTSKAFAGEMIIEETEQHLLRLRWENDDAVAVLEADLASHGFAVKHRTGQQQEEIIMSFDAGFTVGQVG